MLTNDPLSSAPTLPTSEADPTHIRGCCHSAAAAWAREPKPLDEVFTLAASPAASLGALIDDALRLCGEAEKAAGQAAETVEQIARLNRGQSISEDPEEGTLGTKTK